MTEILLGKLVTYRNADGTAAAATLLLKRQLGDLYDTELARVLATLKDGDTVEDYWGEG